ncbi:Polyketide synthase enoylreductase [Penicillium cinerascens]|uniref:Polyketide synthase enoylreductase n=1 Tax=Penicillium cinerascens TaxID=70096 RepID=A0A9W9N1U4_9EURO|nr:Polyketide synthase enoylreductase [Penicillium cinerascens]KAJ5211575.1 Polyketide synthase enoylreductase [Penicillium cinerascens]
MCNAANQRDASFEEQIEDRRREVSEKIFDEIIDPTFLCTESASITLENHASMGTTVEENGHFDPFFRNTQYSSWAGVSSTESEHSETDKGHQTLENIPGDSLAEQQEFEVFGSQALNTDSYDEHVVKEFKSDESSCGFAISSGWSSTFFPSEIEEEPHRSMTIAPPPQCADAQLFGYNVDGTFQQYAVGKATQASKIPKSVPLDAVIRYYALTVAIVGAGGGLGSLAQQYAKAMGLRVVAIDGGDEKRVMCEQLGTEVRT